MPTKDAKPKKYELRKHAMHSQPMVPYGVSDSPTSISVTSVAPAPSEKQTLRTSSSDGSPYLSDPYSMTSVGEALLEAMSPGATAPTGIKKVDQSNPPPAPEWLIPALLVLQRKYHHDNFRCMMRRNAFDAKNNQLTNAQYLQYLRKGFGLKPYYRWVPRIYCHDCPGKLYITGPGKTVDNFKTHLRNKEHRKRVNLRIKKAWARTVWP